MKVKLTLLALSLMLGLNASAQQYSEDYIVQKGNVQRGQRVDMIYGVMAGITVPRLSDKNNVLEVKNTTGYQAGIMWGVDLGGLEIVPEIWYQHDKSQIRSTSSTNSGELVSNSIEVPIIFAMQWGPIRINVGPTFSLMSNSQFNITESETIEPQTLDFGRTKSTVGYSVGLSTLIAEHLILDARYIGRFVSTSKAWYDGYNEVEHYKYRYYGFTFNVGYRF